MKSIAPEKQEAMIANKESCCDQCSMPIPLLCWRYKVKYQLYQNRLKKPGAESFIAQAGQEGEISNSKMVYMRRSPASEAYDTFAILDGWREKLINFIEQESGTFLGEDKSWVSNFYDFENYHQKLAATAENLQSQLSDFQL